jgi:hypothetical protein
MDTMSLEHYEHFCAVISKGPATGLQDTAEMVMALSAGMANPEEIAEWWACWQLLKQAMKDNHPMVKLAEALAPNEPPWHKEETPGPTTKIVPGMAVPASVSAPIECPMAFVPDQGEDDGFWYVRNRSEMSRPAQCRAESVVLIADEWPDGGKRAAEVIAKALSEWQAMVTTYGKDGSPIAGAQQAHRDPSAN